MENKLQRDKSQLSLDFQLWWENKLKPYLNNPYPDTESHVTLTREKDHVLITYHNYKYLVGFEDSNSKGHATDLTTLFLGANETLLPRIKEAIAYVLQKHGSPSDSLGRELEVFNNSQLNTYKKIFGRDLPSVEVGETEYGGEKLTGIKVIAPIVEIPLGQNRGLSENLFVYHRRAIILPTQKVIDACSSAR